MFATFKKNHENQTGKLMVITYFCLMLFFKGQRCLDFRVRNKIPPKENIPTTDMVLVELKLNANDTYLNTIKEIIY